MNILQHSIAQEVIDNWSYKFWVVKRIPSIKCKCVDPVTKQPKGDCKLCLGLGTKIKLYQVKGTSRETKEFESLRAEFPTVTPKIFYIKKLLYIEKDDLIIDKENVYRVYATQFHRGLQGEFKFTRCVCPTVKNNHKQILKNFKEIIYEHNRKQPKNKQERKLR